MCNNTQKYIRGVMAVIKPVAEKKPAGRKQSIDTPEKVKGIIAAVARGIPIKIAAEARGLHESHFYNFINQGIVDLKEGDETVNAKLVKSFKTQQENFIAGCLDDIRASEKGHRGAEWTLERSYWKYFSSNSAVVEMQKQLEEVHQMLAEKDKLKGN
jgi:hypothetical protein